jgi:hypothetical protein
MKLTIKLLATGEPKTLLSDTRKKLEQFLKLNLWIKEMDLKLTYGRDVGGNKVCEMYLKTEEKNSLIIERAVSFEECVDKALRKLKARNEAAPDNDPLSAIST